MKSVSDTLLNEPVIFPPMERFITVSNALSGAIYSYRDNSKNDPYSTIVKLLQISSTKYPNCISVNLQKKESIQLFFLTRILSMLILLDFNPEYYINTLKCFKLNVVIDPIDSLDQLTNFENSQIKSDIGALINLLSIIIEFSDYDNDSISKFITSFNYNFLRVIDLPNLGLDNFLFIKKARDDDDSKNSRTSGISIIKKDKFGNEENNLIYYFLKKDGKRYNDNNNDEDDDDDNNEDDDDDDGNIGFHYACIKMGDDEMNLSLNGQLEDIHFSCTTDRQMDLKKVEYEIVLKENAQKNENFITKINPFRKNIDQTTENTEITAHFTYFTNKMDLLYDQIQKNINSCYPKNGNGINELYSIVYNITIYNYYTAKNMNPKYYRQDNEKSDLYACFLEWENYLLLIIESTCQINSDSIKKDLGNHVVRLIEIYTKLYNDIHKFEKKSSNDDDDDDDDEKEEEDKKKQNIENEEKAAFDRMSKFTLTLILFIINDIYEVNSNTMNMVLNLIEQKGDGKDVDYWMDKYLGKKKPSQKVLKAVKSNITSELKYGRDIFNPSRKVGSLMKNFHLKAIDFITRESEKLEDIIQTINECQLELIPKKKKK